MVKKMLKGKALVPKVTSLGQLRALARTDAKYAALAIATAQNLGAMTDQHKDVDAAMAYLNMNAMETTEEGVVGEVNFCRGLI